MVAGEHRTVGPGDREDDIMNYYAARAAHERNQARLLAEALRWANRTTERLELPRCAVCGHPDHSNKVACDQVIDADGHECDCEES